MSIVCLVLVTIANGCNKKDTTHQRTKTIPTQKISFLDVINAQLSCDQDEFQNLFLGKNKTLALQKDIVFIIDEPVIRTRWIKQNDDTETHHLDVSFRAFGVWGCENDLLGLENPFGSILQYFPIVEIDQKSQKIRSIAHEPFLHHQIYKKGWNMMDANTIQWGCFYQIDTLEKTFDVAKHCESSVNKPENIEKIKSALSKGLQIWTK